MKSYAIHELQTTGLISVLLSHLLFTSSFHLCFKEFTYTIVCWQQQAHSAHTSELCLNSHQHCPNSGCWYCLRLLLSSCRQQKFSAWAEISPVCLQNTMLMYLRGRAQSSLVRCRHNMAAFVGNTESPTGSLDCLCRQMQGLWDNLKL